MGKQKFIELPERTLKLAELCAQTGTTPGQVENWLRQGLIIPAKDARSSGDHRLFSLANAIEVAQAKALAGMGLSTRQLSTIFAAQRQKLQAVLPELRASAIYVFYVQMIQGIAQVTGPWPGYEPWLKKATALLGSWNRKQPDLDGRILQLLAAQSTARSEGQVPGDNRP